MSRKINVALVGLGFGGCFAPIYRDHPDVGEIGIFDINQELTQTFSKETGISKTYKSFEEILADPTVDAVHLVTPIPQHEEQTVRVLEAGKHCACTVPMAISKEGVKRIMEAARKSGKNYMMMETTLYTYHYLHAKGMLERGELGRIQLLRGSHYQDMENWPSYWMGLPPMFYGTHAIAPLVGLSGSRIQRVVCFGSGTMREELHKQYGNPFPVESALFEFENGLKAEATRSLFETAREYTESFCAYGSKRTFEWAQDGGDPVIMTLIPRTDLRGYATEFTRLELGNPYETLPESIRKYTINEGDYDETNPQKSLAKGAGGGHEGSHPHLVHEFVRSIVENRRPAIDEVLGGNITLAGICAHESAMNGGCSVEVPLY